MRLTSLYFNEINARLCEEHRDEAIQCLKPGSLSIIRVSRLLCLQFLFLLLMTPAFATDEQSTAATELAHLLSGYHTYQADFTQRTDYPDSGQQQSSSGRVMMQRPGKFRWEVRRPMPQLIVAQGGIVWVYDETLQQATREKLTQYALNPAALLSGQVAVLLQQYRVSQFTRNGKLWYQLEPRSQSNQASFSKVLMHFSQGQLTEMQVVTSLGQVSEFTFSAIRLNAPMKDNLFIFKPPPGVDVLQDS